MAEPSLPPSSADGARRFPTTRWSVVRRAGETGSEEAAAALERLCREYWYPLYAYARRRGYSPHDAQDLTQSFILELIAGPMLSRADPDKGRFRSFMLGSLQNFLANHHRGQQALKRGGGQSTVSLDQARDEQRFSVEAADSRTPEDLFERNWAFALLDQVLRRLEGEYTAAGRGDLFAALQPYLAGKAGEGGYRAVAEQLGLSENTVGVSVYRMRKRYGELLREEIAMTVSAPDEIEDEIAHLRAVLARG